MVVCLLIFGVVLGVVFHVGGGLIFFCAWCSCAGFSFGFSVGGCPFFPLSVMSGFRFASGRQCLLLPVLDLLFAGGGSSVAVFHSIFGMYCGVISAFPVIEGSFRCRFLFWHLPFGTRPI